MIKAGGISRQRSALLDGRTSECLRSSQVADGNDPVSGDRVDGEATQAQVRIDIRAVHGTRSTLASWERGV